MLKKSTSILLMILCSLTAVAALTADETQEITGTVMSINVETGEMIVKDDSGEMRTLMADPKEGVDLKMLKEGDAVNVESDSKGVVKSLEISK